MHGGFVLVVALLVSSASCDLPATYYYCHMGLADRTECCEMYEPGEAYFMADTKDCTAYYSCQDGKPVQHHCDEGSIWNYDAEICTPSDFPDLCSQKRD